MNVVLIYLSLLFINKWEQLLRVCFGVNFIGLYVEHCTISIQTLFFISTKIRIITDLERVEIVTPLTGIFGIQNSLGNVPAFVILTLVFNTQLHDNCGFHTFFISFSSKPFNSNYFHCNSPCSKLEQSI